MKEVVRDNVPRIVDRPLCRLLHLGLAHPWAESGQDMSQ